MFLPLKRLALPIFVLLAFSASANPALSQNVQFARTFNVNGGLVGIDSVFNYRPPNVIVAMKMTSSAPLSQDTLYVVVKDVDGTAGRFYMKRSSQNKYEANALVRLKNDGIFRVYVYDPRRRTRPLAYSRLYITSSLHPNRAALVQKQKEVLMARGVISGSRNTERPNAVSGTSGTDAASNNSNNTSSSASNNSEMASSEQSNSDFNDDFEVGLDDMEDDLGGMDDDFSGFDDDFSLDEELDMMDDSFEDFEDFDSDVEGDFESFDDLDDDFDFEISDF